MVVSGQRPARRRSQGVVQRPTPHSCHHVESCVSSVLVAVPTPSQQLPTKPFGARGLPDRAGTLFLSSCCATSLGGNAPSIHSGFRLSASELDSKERGATLSGSAAHGAGRVEGTEAPKCKPNVASLFLAVSGLPGRKEDAKHRCAVCRAALGVLCAHGGCTQSTLCRRFLMSLDAEGLRGWCLP